MHDGPIILTKPHRPRNSVHNYALLLISADILFSSLVSGDCRLIVVVSTQTESKFKSASFKSLSAVGLQAVCNVPSMSAAQSTTVLGGLLHPHLKHCSSAASAVRRQPSAVRTAIPGRSMFGRRAFSVAGPAACNSLPDYLRDASRSFDSFRRT